MPAEPAAQRSASQQYTSLDYRGDPSKFTSKLPVRTDSGLIRSIDSSTRRLNGEGATCLGVHSQKTSASVWTRAQEVHDARRNSVKRRHTAHSHPSAD